MKKTLLFIAAITLLLMTACTKDPSISVTPDQFSVSFIGETVNAVLSSNCAWTATASDPAVKVSPSKGSGDSPISITVAPNSENKNKFFDITFTCDGSAVSALISIQQSAEAVTIGLEKSEDNLSYLGGNSVTKLFSTYAWTCSTDCKELIITPASGDGDAEITITVPENKTPDELKHVVTFESEGLTVDYTITQLPATVLSYGGVDYKIKWLADGNLWMCENLRFVPEGKTISEDPTDNNGIWYSCGIDKKAETDPESVALKGLLYDAETAFGGVTITKDNFATFDGVQGICPDGWHIPSKTDFINLVGKGVGELETKEDAPYYDSATGKSSVAKANEDGFNIATYGYRNQNNVTTKGAYLGVVYEGTLASDMILGSSVAIKNGEPTYTPMGADDPTIKNVQYYSLMPFINATNNSLNVALCNFKSGVHIRCVKNAD